ncbi:outer membrane protein [Maritalea porphyrae]|jgi:outer membrane immunogenic protein|uniref:outer membrane protein n=1 Tax=Maritalea porphyrae TaxID=880732 RepID=UPI0022AE8B3B|nr:hypothetical protein [Maritalea porphyrae]MCZ4273005.1 hypothetical protein [Maritalea porphyrae]
MTILKKISIAALAGVAMSAAAFAADPVTNYASDPSAAYATSGFNWDGFYVGLNTGYVNTGTAEWAVGGVTGLNIQDGALVYGAELEVNALVASGAFTGAMSQASARAGYLVSDDMLVYGVGGGGFDKGAGIGLVGAGMEFALTQEVTLGAEYNYLFNSGGGLGHEIDGKVRWYFN